VILGCLLVGSCTRSQDGDDSDSVNRGAGKSTELDRKETDAGPNDVAEKKPNDAKTFYNRGVVKMKEEDYAGAVADFDKAIELNPKDAGAFFLRGNSKLHKHDYGGAIEDHSMALMLKDGDFPEAWRQRALAKWQSGRFPEAMSDIETAIERDSSSARAYHVRGLMVLSMPDYDEAIADFERAMKLYEEKSADSDLASSYFDWARALAGKNDKAGMLEKLKKAIDLDSEYKKAVEEAACFKPYLEDPGFKKLTAP
jgi:tetratricopeptide (TPR) repeat protein